MTWSATRVSRTRDYFDIRIAAEDKTQTHPKPKRPSDASDTIRIVDNPLLTAGGRAYGSGDQETSLKWKRIPNATSYSVEYRVLAWNDYMPGHSPSAGHWDLDWPNDDDWPYYQNAAGPLNSPVTFQPVTVAQPSGSTVNPSKTIKDLPTLRVLSAPAIPEGTPLVRTQIYAFQVNYVTTTGEKVFSARDAYVWPSDDFPENGELVGTYTFFGHHPNREFEYIICKDTFDDPNTSGVNEGDQWVKLIKSAFGQWGNVHGSIHRCDSPG